MNPQWKSSKDCVSGRNLAEIESGAKTQFPLSFRPGIQLYLSVIRGSLDFPDVLRSRLNRLQTSITLRFCGRGAFNQLPGCARVGSRQLFCVEHRRLGAGFGPVPGAPAALLYTAGALLRLFQATANERQPGPNCPGQEHSQFGLGACWAQFQPNLNF